MMHVKDCMRFMILFMPLTCLMRLYTHRIFMASLEIDEMLSVCCCERGYTHVMLPKWTNISRPTATGGSAHLAINLDAMDETRDDLLDALEGLKPKKARVAHTLRGDYSTCVWMRYLKVDADDPINDPTSFAATVFETRFRTPWAFFRDQLLPWTLRRWPHKADAFGRYGIPIEFKLLAVLRVLGRAMHFDDVAEYIGCGFKGEAIRIFYHSRRSRP
jgi:hypothetical protein